MASVAGEESVQERASLAQREKEVGEARRGPRQFPLDAGERKLSAIDRSRNRRRRSLLDSSYQHRGCSRSLFRRPPSLSSQNRERSRRRERVEKETRRSEPPAALFLLLQEKEGEGEGEEQRAGGWASSTPTLDDETARGPASAVFALDICRERGAISSMFSRTETGISEAS